MTGQKDAALPHYVHATALAIGEAGLLIRGASGAGKSLLADRLIAEARRQGLFARLVGDDRVQLRVMSGRLVARPHPAIAGRLERRGIGIVSVSPCDAVVIRAVIDLREGAIPRHPAPEDKRIEIFGIALPRLSRSAGLIPMDEPAIVLDWLASADQGKP